MTEKIHPREPACVLILGASYGTGNLGVDALLSGSIRSLLWRNPDASIAVLDFCREGAVFRVPHDGAEIEVQLINLRFSWKFWLKNNGFRLLALSMFMRLVPIPAVRRTILAAHPALGTVDRCTSAVALSGGDSFSDIYGIRRLLYVSLPQLLVLAMGRPLVLLPQTLGPFKTRRARWIAGWIMRRSRRVFSRDHASLAAARELLGPAAEHLGKSPDMAFALEPATPPDGLPGWATAGRRPLVGLNVSGLLYRGGYTGRNMFGLEGDYPRMMRRLIQRFILDLGCDVALVSHVKAASESDISACESIFNELAPETGGRLHFADPDYDHREVKAFIGRCDFFLGSRMHACIAALSQEIPAVGLAYSRKFAGVFESVGVKELVVDLRDLSEDEALERVEALFHRRDQFVGRLQETVPPARDAALNLLTRIAGPGQADVVRVPEDEPISIVV